METDTDHKRERVRERVFIVAYSHVGVVLGCGARQKKRDSAKADVVPSKPQCNQQDKSTLYIVHVKINAVA